MATCDRRFELRIGRCRSEGADSGADATVVLPLFNGMVGYPNVAAVELINEHRDFPLVTSVRDSSGGAIATVHMSGGGVTVGTRRWVDRAAVFVNGDMRRSNRTERMRVSVGSDYLADGGFGWAWRWSNVTSRPVPHPLSPSATSAWDSWLRSERDLGWDSEENATFCDALRVACAANVTVRGMFH